MKKASNVALAIGAGYLLGRKRKLRLALAVAGAAASGKLGSVATQAVKRGGSRVGSSEALGKLSPELAGVMGTVREDLADAGKAAVRTAAASRINRLTDSLHERAEVMRNPRDEDMDEAGDGEPAAPDDDSGRNRPARRRAAETGDNDSGPRRRAKRPEADGGSRSSAARKRGK
jgi:hypothetical protein